MSAIGALLAGAIVFFVASGALAARTDNKYGKNDPTPAPTPDTRPMTTEEFFGEAVGAFQIGDLRRAEEATRAAISLDPRNPEYHYLLGRVHLYRAAEENRLEIRSWGVEAPASKYVKAYVKGRDRLIAAKNEFETVTKLAPQNASGWLNLGTCQDNLGQEDEAIASYLKAIELSPYSEIARDANNNLGLVYQAEGQKEEALRAYESALRIDPTFAPTRGNMERLLEANPKLKKKALNK
ncbi:tetratricopeptide repeat protein [bacterium]|nr:tetratricopeptide repeat protein [bacterium]